MRENHPEIYVFRNTGSSWSSTRETWADDSNYPNFQDSSKGLGIVDLNGDGFAELIKTHSSGSHSTWDVFINTGSSWNSAIQWWNNVAVDASLNQANVRLLDVNGDGLPDVLKTTHSGSNATWLVYKNTGSTWNTSAETWVNNANIDAYLDHADVSVGDVNGDGLPDIVKIVDLGGANEVKVLLNKGDSWSTSWETWVGTGANLDINDNTEMVDVTGDGLLELVQTPNNGSMVTWKVFLNKNRTPHLLSSIKTGQGGNISFDYASTSAMFDNTGADSLPDLPFGIPVVNKMTVANGMTGSHATTDVTTYTYQDGLHDWQDKEFRGFETVDTTEPDSSKRKYVFLQSDAYKGLLSEVQQRNSSSDPFAETENTWSNTASNGVTTVKLDTVKQYTYDGSASNPKIIQTDYTYDSYGNITKQSELGDTGTSSDNRYIYHEYTDNTNDWIVNTPKHTYIHASNGIVNLTLTSAKRRSRVGR